MESAASGSRFRFKEPGQVGRGRRDYRSILSILESCLAFSLPCREDRLFYAVGISLLEKPDHQFGVATHHGLDKFPVDGHQEGRAFDKRGRAVGAIPQEGLRLQETL